MTDKPQNNPYAEIDRRNKRIGLMVLVVVVGMVGLSFAAVPMYRLFCQVTGFGGQAQMDLANKGLLRDRFVRVNFNTDVAPDLPWSFTPDQKEVRAQVGADTLVSYTVHNETAAPIIGTATYNVTPLKAGKYFHKTQCFCFGQQRLTAGQKTSFPVVFYIDPAFADDPNMQDVTTITLSYTFFKSESQALERALEAFYTDDQDTN